MFLLAFFILVPEPEWLLEQALLSPNGEKHFATLIALAVGVMKLGGSSDESPVLVPNVSVVAGSLKKLPSARAVFRSKRVFPSFHQRTK